MNKYIFLTSSIAGIGGAKQYLSNKVNFLQGEGWTVFVFSSFAKSIYVENLKQFKELKRPALMYYPYFFRKGDIRENIDFILHTIDYKEGDRIVIESSSTSLSMWGEIVAKETNGKHLIFDLQERHYTNEGEKDFLRFKLNRHEFAGINKMSVADALKEPDLPFREDMSIVACCSNVTADIKEQFSDQLNKDAKYTFGSIGRLEKPCVMPIMAKLKEFCLSHKEDKINIILIGGSGKSIVDGIRKFWENAENVTLVITGSIYPIPRSLINRADLFVSASGSATVTYQEHIPTIKVSPDNGLPLGIVGYSFVWGNMFSPNENETILGDIDLILNNSINIEYEENPQKQFEEKMRREFAKQVELANYPEENVYYDIENIKLKLTTKKEKAYYLLGHLFGCKGMQKVMLFLRKNHLFTKYTTASQELTENEKDE